MQLPHDTKPTALPKLPEGGLTSKLRAPAEALPGDHGARFGDELEQAAARSAGDGAEGRRGERRGEERRRSDRTERARPADAREARRRKAKQDDDRRRTEVTDTQVQQPGRATHQARIDTVRRRVATARAEEQPSGSKIPLQSDQPERPADPAASAAPGAAPLAPAMPGSATTTGAVAPKGPEAVAAATRTQRPTALATPATPEAKQPGTPATGPRTDKAPQADAMGELLTQREEALEREASILRQLRAQLGPGRRELTMRLDPAELGRMHLRLALRGGRLTATLRAESPEALTAIERQLPELAASLEAQGFEVQDFDLDLAQGGLADERGGDATPAAPLPGLLTQALGAEAPRPTTTEQRGPRVAPDSSSPDALDLLV